MIGLDSRYLQQDRRILVAYSGGADSTCLLTLLVEAGYDVVAGHLHHGLRPEAQREADLCAAYAEQLCVPFVGGRADTQIIAQNMGIGLEEAGRRARYEFLQQAAQRLDCSVIVTGHTADDHAETVLLNLTRGTGLKGAGGIPSRRDNIVRPLLHVSRASTRAFCEERGLWFHDDPTNFEPEIPRVRVRQVVLPELSAINPKVVDALNRFAELAREEDEFLDGAAAALLEQLEVVNDDPLAFLTRDVEISIRRGGLQAAPIVLRRRCLRLLAGMMGTELDRDTVETILGALAEEEAYAIDLAGGETRLRLTPVQLKIELVQEEEPFRHPLTLPGETLAETMGWVLTASHASPTDFLRPRRSLDVKIDADKVRGGLHFRSGQVGERITPLGMEGSKLVSDILQESGLSRHARRRLPLVCDMVGPIWVPTLAIAQRVAIDDESARAIHLTFGAIVPNQP